MSLGGEANIANVAMSLNKYMNDNLHKTENFAIDFKGLPFDNKMVSEWIQPRIIDTISEYVGHASSTDYGEQANILFQVNIFVKKSGITTSYRPEIIRDVVANYFKIGQEISLKNYMSGGTNPTTLCSMKVRDITTDRALLDTDTEYSYAYAVEIDYTRKTTKA